MQSVLDCGIVQAIRYGDGRGASLTAVERRLPRVTASFAGCRHAKRDEKAFLASFLYNGPGGTKSCRKLEKRAME
jgi:hypothetical protein